MKKRLLVIIMALALVMALVLAGCGAKKNAEGTSATETGADTVVAGEEGSDAEQADSIAASSTSVEEDVPDAKEIEKSDKDSGKDDAKESPADQAKEPSKEKNSSTDSKSSTDAVTEKKESKEDAATKPETSEQSEAPAQPETPAQTETPTQPETPAQPEAPKKTDYGRILFIGDSRSVDMFSADRSGIFGEVYDGITVYAEDARGVNFLIETMSAYDTNNFDTMISWMGCNDYGNFAAYQPHYEGLLREGKTLILCTVGPTLDEGLANDFDRTHYTNGHQIAYNNQLWAWANANGVKVIDLYTYLSNTGDVYIDPNDGIHYQPKPTTVIWSYILSSLY